MGIKGTIHPNILGINGNFRLRRFNDMIDS